MHLGALGNLLATMPLLTSFSRLQNLPKAIRRVYVRIVVFYLLGTFVIGLLVASNDPRLNLSSGDAASSPFVIAIQNAGIPALPSIINAALLTSAWSAASSDLCKSYFRLLGEELEADGLSLR